MIVYSYLSSFMLLHFTIYIAVHFTFKYATNTNYTPIDFTLFIYLLIYLFLAVPGGLWDLSSPTRD